jgi:hypothetical protein
MNVKKVSYAGLANERDPGIEKSMFDRHNVAQRALVRLVTDTCRPYHKSEAKRRPPDRRHRKGEMGERTFSKDPTHFRIW